MTAITNNIMQATFETLLYTGCSHISALNFPHCTGIASLAMVLSYYFIDNYTEEIC